MSDGVTASERYLARLGRLSFLRLWSWPNLFRDQRAGSKTEGKEVCDLLVVFDRHVFIFSDKYCAFPATADVKTDWARWFKRAVWASAQQIWGAQRWIMAHPDRLFCDRACTVRLPIGLPPAAEAVFHCIAVAHGASTRCREMHGSSGSLMLRPDIVGSRHWEPQADVVPFTVGTLDPKRGIVHVLDDFTLDAILKTVDTVSDLAGYLEDKERLIGSGKLGFAAGEEEMLAHYLMDAGVNGRHTFGIAADVTHAVFTEGIWDRFVNHRDRLAQIEANKVSYVWDRLIDRFTEHVLHGTLQYDTDRTVAEVEVALRFMAAENRTERRMLARALLETVERGRNADRFARVIQVGHKRRGKPFYVFMTLKQPPGVPEDRYRRVRREMLIAYCLVHRWKRPSVQHIVGIATQPGDSHERSEDLTYLDGSQWDDAMASEAARLQQDHQILTSTRRHTVSDSEYPAQTKVKYGKGGSRNAPCYCGSGRKYKKCHGG